jgi:gamma-D-glutamyl-L-lysine dipeptidyl-peptidase
MNTVIATAAIAPVLAAAGVRSEQTSQLILGETGRVHETSGDWLRIRNDVDGYDGWVHRGYVRLASDADAARWRREATAWSDGARLDSDGITRPIPLRARLVLDGDVVILPDGGRGRLVAGAIGDAAAARDSASAQPPERWALQRFGGAAYQWGGLTPWGVDCSGLVQTTFLARGLVVPRDSSAQALFGSAIEPAIAAPGDLLFFRSESGAPAITHVAFLAADRMLIHSTIACGGVVHESFTPGSRAGDLLGPRLAAARRYPA